MLNLFVVAVLFIFTNSIFSYSFAYSGISRTFAAFGKGAAECSVVSLDSLGNELDHPYFDGAEFANRASLYFEENLSRYLTKNQEAELDFYYFDAFSAGNIEELAKPTGIRMNFRCPVLQYGYYENTATFILRQGDSYGD